MALSTISALNSTNATVTVPGFADLAGNISPSYSLDNAQQTYRATASFTPFATAPLGLVTVTGSATKTVRIKKIMLGGIATALADTLFRLTRLSVIGTGGTASAPTIAKLDTNSAAATAVVQAWTTAAQSTGTVVAALATWRQFIGTVTTPATAWIEQGIVYPEKGLCVGQSLVLRGVNDFIQLENFNAGNLGAATVLEYTIEWTEDAS